MRKNYRSFRRAPSPRTHRRTRLQTHTHTLRTRYTHSPRTLHTRTRAGLGRSKSAASSRSEAPKNHRGKVGAFALFPPLPAPPARHLPAPPAPPSSEARSEAGSAAGARGRSPGRAGRAPGAVPAPGDGARPPAVGQPKVQLRGFPSLGSFSFRLARETAPTLTSVPYVLAKCIGSSKAKQHQSSRSSPCRRRKNWL